MPPTSLKDVLQPASLGYTRVLTTITVDVNIDDLGNVRIDCIREDKDLGKKALLPRKTYWTEEYRWNRLTVGSPAERRNWSLKSIVDGVDAPAEEYLRYIEGRTSPKPEALEAGPQVEEPESTDEEKVESDVSYPIPEINNLDTAVEADETFSSEEEEDRPPAPPPRVDSVANQDKQPEETETVTETDSAIDRTQPEDAEEPEVEEVVLRIVEPLDETVLDTTRTSEEVSALPPESPDIIQDTSPEDTIIPEDVSDQQVEEDVDKDEPVEEQEVVDNAQLKSPKRVRFHPEAIYVSTIQEAVEEEGASLSPIPEEDTTAGKQTKEPETTSREEGKDDDSDAEDKTQDTQISVEVDVHVSADKEAEDDQTAEAPLAEEEILTTDDEATESAADDKEETQPEAEVEADGEQKEDESGPSAEEAHKSKDEADETEQDEEGEEPQAPHEKASIEEVEPSQEEEAVQEEEEAVLDESDVSSVPRESLGEEELQALISDDWDLLTNDEADDDDYPPLNGYCPPKSPVGGQVAEPVVVEFDESYAEVLKKAPPADEEETPEDETPSNVEAPQEDEVTSEDKAPSEEEATSEDKAPSEGEATSKGKAPSEEEATSKDDAPSEDEEADSEDKAPSEDEATDRDTKEDDSPSIGPDDTPKEEESESEEEAIPPQADEQEESQQEDTKASEAAPSPKEEISTPDDEKVQASGDEEEEQEEEKSQPPTDKQSSEDVDNPQESNSDEWDLSDYEAGEEDFPPLNSYRPPKSPIGGKPTEPVAAEFKESFAAVVTKPPQVVEEAVEEAEPVEAIPSTKDEDQTEVLPEKEEEQEEGPTEEPEGPDVSPGEDDGEESSKDDKEDHESQDTITGQKDEEQPVSDGAASDEDVIVPSEVTEDDDKDDEDNDGGSLEAVRGDTPTDEDLSEKADFESSEKTEGEDSAGADTSSVGSTEHDLKKDETLEAAGEVGGESAEISADDLPAEKAEDVSESPTADNVDVDNETPADESGEEEITSDHEATEADTEEPVKEEDNKRSPLQRQGAMSKGESIESQESATSADTSDQPTVKKTEPERQANVKAGKDIPEEDLDVETGDDDDDSLNKAQEEEMPEGKTRETKSQDSSDSEDDSSSKTRPQALATGESTPRDDTKEQCEFAVTSADREYQPNTGASNEGNTECTDGHCSSEPQAMSLPQSEMSCPEQDTGRLRVLPWARWEKIDDTSPRTVRRRPPFLELEAPVCEATSEETSPIQQRAEPMDIKEANEPTPRRSSTSLADTSEEEEEEEEAISSGDEEGEFDVPERTESPEDRMTRTDAWATSGGTLYIGAATRMVRNQLPDIPEHSREDDSEASDDDNQQDEVERPRQSSKLADSRSSGYTHDRHHEELESSDESDDELDPDELHYLDNDDEEQVMMVEENIPEGNPLYLRQIQGDTYTQQQTSNKDDTSSDDSEDEDRRQAVMEHDRLLELQEDLFEKDSLDDVDYHMTSSEVLRECEDQSNLSATEPVEYRCDGGEDKDPMTNEQADPSNANETLLASGGPGEDMDSDHEEFQVTVSEKHLADTSTQHLIVITKDTVEDKDHCQEKTSMDSFESSGPSTEGGSDTSDDDASSKKKRRRRQKYGEQRSFTEAIHHDPDSPTYISRMNFQFKQPETTDSEMEQPLEGLSVEEECTPTQENIPVGLVTDHQSEQMCTVEDQVNEKDGTKTTVPEPGAESVGDNDQEDDTFDQIAREQDRDAKTDPAMSSDLPRDDNRRRSAEYTDSSDSDSDTDTAESETSADSILASPGHGGPGSSGGGGQYRTPLATVPVTSYFVTSGVPFTMDPTTSEHVEIPPMPTSPRHSWGMQANYSFEEHQPVTTGLLTPVINGHIPVVKHHVQYDDLKRPIIPILLDIGDKLSPEYSGETKPAETCSSEREILSPSSYDNLLESDLAEGEAQQGLDVESLQPMSCRCVAPPPDRKPFESPSDELELPPNPDFKPMDCLCTLPPKGARVVWSPKHSPRHSPQNVERCYEAISNTLATSRHNYVECKRQEQDAEDEATVLNQCQSSYGDDSVGDMPEGRTVTMLQFDMEDDRSSETSSPLSVHSTHLGTPPILEEELDDSPAFSPTRQMLDTFIPVSPPVREIRHPGITQDAIRAPRARKFAETEDSMSPVSNRDDERKTPTGSLLFPYDKIHGPYPPQDQPSFVTPDRRTQVKRKRPSDDVQGTSPRPTYTSPIRPRTDSPAEKCLSPSDHRPKDVSPSKIPDDFPKLCTGKVRSMVSKWEEIVKKEPPKSPLMPTSSPSSPEIPRYGERDVISPPFSHHGSSPYYMSRRRTGETSPEGASAKQQKVPKHNVDVSSRRPLHGSHIVSGEEEESIIAATEYGVPFQTTTHEDGAEKVLVYGYEVEWDIPRLQVCLSPREGFDDDEDSMSDDVTISSLTETDGEGGVSASLSSLEEYILDPSRILGRPSSFTELPMSPVEEEEESPAEDSAQGSSNTKEALSSHSVWERLGVLETPCPYFCQMWLPMLKYHLLDFQ